LHSAQRLVRVGRPLLFGTLAVSGVHLVHQCCRGLCRPGSMPGGTSILPAVCRMHRRLHRRRMHRMHRHRRCMQGRTGMDIPHARGSSTPSRGRSRPGGTSMLPAVRRMHRRCMQDRTGMDIPHARGSSTPSRGRSRPGGTSMLPAVRRMHRRRMHQMHPHRRTCMQRPHTRMGIPPVTQRRFVRSWSGRWGRRMHRPDQPMGRRQPRRGHAHIVSMR
jgi:hypothetical protein